MDFFGGLNLTAGKADRKSRLVALVIPAVVLILILTRVLNSVGVELVWFESLGYRGVYTTVLLSKIAVFAAAFFAGFIITFLNLFFFLRVSGDRLNRAFSLGIAVLVGLIVGASCYPSWEIVLKYIYGQPFGVQDPQFNKDISFFVFKIPFYNLMLSFLRSVIFFNVLALVLAGFIFKMFRLNLDTRDETGEGILGSFSGQVEEHLKAGEQEDTKRFLTFVGFWAALWIASSFIAYKLSAFGLVYSQLGAVYGAGATDVAVRIPAYNTFSFIAIAAAVLVFFYARKNLKLAAVFFVGFYILSGVLTGIVPSLYQSFRVKPNEIELETPYLERNISYTRAAYGLENIKEVDYPLGRLTGEALEENRDIIENVRLLDYRALKDTYAQQQEIRLYYQFPSVDVDRYQLGGKKVQVMLAARELEQKNIPAEAQTFNNLVFKYTHGFGVVMSPVNRVTQNGLPEYFIKDIPPVSDVMFITQPRIYFGELTDRDVIVNTKIEEMDYPVGEDNATYVYQGDAGIRLTFLNRLMLAYRDWELKYFLSTAITGESQMLMRRNVLERVRALAPFLSFDPDPYLVVGQNGKLYYIVDGYTVTDKYPYSEAFGNINYIRNSVKAVVDAYSGETEFYIFEPGDPLIRTYDKIFDGLFRYRGEFPEYLAGHIRYPEALFERQCQVMKTYHMENPVVFFNKEDKWEIPRELYYDETQIMEPYYTLLKLPGEEQPEFIIMRPFTPAEKQNMNAWLAGRSDGEHYGELLLYKFPKGIRVPGPMQIEASIDQDAEISQRLTLWGQGGSRVIRGNLLIYPIGGSLIGVESLFIQSSSNKFPQLKKVFVSYQDEVVMKNTLEEALEALVSGLEVPEEPGDGEAKEEERSIDMLLQDIIRAFRKTQEAAGRNAWEEFGRSQQELSELIAELEAYSEAR